MRDSTRRPQAGRQLFKSPEKLAGFQYRVESSELAQLREETVVSKVSEFGSHSVNSCGYSKGMQLVRWV